MVVLDLSTERQSCLNFPLINIPTELFKLSQLKRLHFDCNQIKIIPDEFGTSMVNLETLTISNNRLKWLPPTFKNLKKLQSLHLSHNKFDLFPEVLCEMPRLRFLDLSTNNIDALPTFIGDIVDLESLLLFHNNIKEVPRGIGDLKNLRTLWLGENKIIKLPKEITKLKYLDWNEDSFYLSSNLGGNPLVDPPLKVCLKGIQEIRIYFQEHEIIRKPTLTQINNYNDNTEAKSRLSNVSQLSAYPD
jgi:Leucine-rich repeat (LRR) protein